MKVDTPDINDVIGITQRAGVCAMQYYGTDVHVDVKADQSPVTHADLAAHGLLVEQLKPFGFPVVSEEDYEVSRKGEYAYWVVDPLDGTKDFIHGTGDFAVMVALVVQGRPIQSVVVLPAKEVTYYATLGQGAYKITSENESRMHVSSIADASEARMLVSRSHPSEVARKLQEALRISHIVPAGSNGVKLGLIAEGKAEFYINPTSHMGWWDLAAPQLLVEEAGGVVTNSLGRPLRYSGQSLHVPNGVLASNLAMVSLLQDQQVS